MVRRVVAFVLVLTAALVVAGPAAASLRDEVRAGQAVAEQLRADATSCDRLTADELERLGEFVMSRMTGSLALHEAMDERMRSVLGAENAERMHALMGRRYAGCGVRGGAGPMMGARDWGWMRDGSWQRMSRADWQQLGVQWMGPGMMRAADGGWQTRDYVLLGVAIVLAAGLLVALLARRPWHRGDGGLAAG